MEAFFFDNRLGALVGSKVGKNEKKTLPSAAPPEIGGAAQGYHNSSLEINDSECRRGVKTSTSLTRE